MWMRLLPLLLFTAVLLLPLFARVTGMPRVAPLEEYRKLAEWPDADTYFAGGNSDFLGYTAKLNIWHLDNFATRAFWVRLRTQTLFTLFGESDQVHLGPDGWMFYRSVIDVETPALERTPAEYRQALIGRFERLSELLDQRGIQLYVMPLALKHRYYPEFLPHSASHARKFRFYDQLMDELISSDRLRVVDSREPLEQAKREGLKIFHQTDFHWTDPAAAVVFRGLLRTVTEEEGLQELANAWHHEVVDETLAGGQGRAIPLFHLSAEQTVGLMVHAPHTRYVAGSDTPGIEWSMVAEPGQDRLLQPILAFGDSFLDAAVRAGFFSSFESVARARLFNHSLVQAYQQRPPGTRYLLIEWITSGTFGADIQITELIAALESEVSKPAGP